MNIFKRYKEKQIDKKVKVYFDCLGDENGTQAKTIELFFKYDADVIDFDCPFCKTRLYFKYNKYVIDHSNKRSKNTHYSTLIK